jgi:hypothetical protein
MGSKQACPIFLVWEYGATYHVGYTAVTNPTWFGKYGALNHVRFRAAMHPTWCMARPARLERAACGFEVRRSIQLSYGRFGVSEGT